MTEEERNDVLEDERNDVLEEEIDNSSYSIDDNFGYSDISIENAGYHVLSEDKFDLCSICCEAIKNGLETPCHHIFHRGCILKWISQYQSRCPCCCTNISIQCEHVEISSTATLETGHRYRFDTEHRYRIYRFDYNIYHIMSEGLRFT